MRLIDADKFKDCFNTDTAIGKTMRLMIDEQTTAYDADKVVERLKTELNLAGKEKERCARENPLQFDTAKGYAQGISVALEIVKSGSVADEQVGG